MSVTFFHFSLIFVSSEMPNKQNSRKINDFFIQCNILTELSFYPTIVLPLSSNYPICIVLLINTRQPSPSYCGSYSPYQWHIQDPPLITAWMINWSNKFYNVISLVSLTPIGMFTDQTIIYVMHYALCVESLQC